MSNRLSRITTRTGDNGTTGLADGSRLNKSHIRIHCLGDIDELNAIIGLCASIIQQPQTLESLLHIQHDLFDLGAELCQPSKQLMGMEHTDYLNLQSELLNENLTALTEFILPGGTSELAHLHLARTVCRRVERNLVELDEHEKINPNSLIYINRLSDFLFILTRNLAKITEQPEIYWQSAYSRVKPENE